MGREGVRGEGGGGWISAGRRAWLKGGRGGAREGRAGGGGGGCMSAVC